MVIGIGGGGDVVGALATAESVRRYQGADPIIGGITWERQPVDPRPGPRTLAEIESAREIATGVALAGAGTRVRENGVLFAESRMAGFLGSETLLVDPSGGPAAIAAGLAEAMTHVGSDLIVFLDVGGDVLAHGHEPTLGSPLCDAVMLAAAARMQESGQPVLAGIFGPSCDGELTLAEVSERLAELGRAGALAGARGITPPIAALLEAAIVHVVTEASAQAVRAFRGETGTTTIRDGRRALELTPAGALTIYFDALGAFNATAPLARAVVDAPDLAAANRTLRAIGVSTELDGEYSAAATGGQAA